MAGQPVSTTPITVADTASAFCTKINANTAALETELARKVVPADMAITDDVPFAGHAITQLSRVLLEDAGFSTTDAGSLYYSGGEFWLVTGAGAIKLTLNGAINISTTGGITGDYPGASGANVNYTHSTKVYAFVDAPGGAAASWSHLQAASVILVAGTSGATLEIKPSAANTGGVWALPNLPAAGTRHVLTVDADGTVRDDDTIDADTTFTGHLKTAVDRRHSDSWTKRLSLAGICTFSVSSNAGDGVGLTTSDPADVGNGLLKVHGNVAGNSFRLRNHGLRDGDRILSASIRFTKLAANTTTLSVIKIDQATGTATTLFTANTNTITTGVLTASGVPASGIGSTEEWVVSVVNAATDNASSLYWDVKITYDHP